MPTGTDLAGYPEGSVVTVQGVVLTGYRHLLYENLSGGKTGMNAIRVSCGREGPSYVWRGKGLRATTQPSYVDCPACRATDDWKRRVGDDLH